MTKFTNYNAYLLENINSYKYYYHLEKNFNLHIVLLNNDQTLGYINFWKYKNHDWDAISIAAEHGYGYKMFEAAMDFIYPEWFVPTRNKAITPEVINTISRLIDRDVVETQKIKPDDESYIEISEDHDFWFNRRYRLKFEWNIEFNSVNYNFIKKTGLKLFSKKYPWNSKTSIE